MEERTVSPTKIDENINVIKMGNMKRVHIRVKNGKIQRERMLSARKGWKVKNGQPVQQSFREKINRQVSQRIARVKRRMKLQQAIRKRYLSNLKRNAQIQKVKKWDTL